ncbi:MAG: hypothetical protein AAF214_06700 [Pseudomonadota bacterium]
MRHMKEIVTAVGTLAIAVGIGFVMQSSESAKERYGTQARPDSIPDSVPAVIPGDETVTGNASADVLLQVQEIELTSASDSATAAVPSREASVQRVSVPANTDQPEPQDFLPLSDACTVTAGAVASVGAMVHLTLDAPCAVNERLTIHHNGMMFTESTDDAGQVDLTVPALTQDAVFILAFANGNGAVAQVSVPDLAQYDRVVLQWRGRAGFELHAREFGANYGQAGHVWSGIDQDPTGLTTGETGFLMRMGNTQSPEPLMAEVYTFPSGMAAKSGTVDLSVEAEVTQTNCGVEIEAQSLEMMQGGQMKTRALTLSVPDCDAMGSFLVLNNLVSDLKVASN